MDAFPAWAKNLRARLAAGIHTIKFRARSPSDPDLSDVCQTVINVKSTAPQPSANNYPEVVYCPPNVKLQLEPNELHRPVFWKDPQFNSDKQLKQILATQLPGTKFAAGRHNIEYTATDVLNRNATCRFTITLHAAATPVERKCFRSGIDYIQSYHSAMHLKNAFCFYSFLAHSSATKQSWRIYGGKLSHTAKRSRFDFIMSGQASYKIGH